MKTDAQSLNIIIIHTGTKTYLEYNLFNRTIHRFDFNSLVIYYTHAFFKNFPVFFNNAYFFYYFN